MQQIRFVASNAPSRHKHTLSISAMLVATRRLPGALLRRVARPASTTARDSDKVPTNDPQPPKDPPNVSSSNAVPVSTQGIRSGTLQETPAEGERRREMQAPNRKEVWSRSQQPRERAMTGPRFEQTIMEYQVRYSTTLLEALE